MYSVRGYDEYEVVADGGLLASIQYEFDWLRYNEAIERDEMEDDSNRPANEYFTLSKLTPLLFTDYGRSDMKDPVAGEKDNVILWSVGVGTVLEFGNNLSATCYYGYPLRKTDGTRRGKGRVSAGFMLRW
jgi:hemolysin activation/secretion protein